MNVRLASALVIALAFGLGGFVHGGAVSAAGPIPAIAGPPADCTSTPPVGWCTLPGVGVELNEAGPLNTIIVGQDATMQMQDGQFSQTSSCSADNNCGEMYPSDALLDGCSADDGVWVGIGTTEYGPDMDDATIHCDGTATGSLSPDVFYTPVSQTVSGAGTGGNPYESVTTVSLTSTLNLVQTVLYAVGSQQINQKIQLVSTAGTVTANVFHGGDIYLAESDYGFPYFVHKTGDTNSNNINFQVGGVNAIDEDTGETVQNCAAPDGTDPVGPGNYHEFLAPDSTADHFVEDFYDTVWGDIDSAIHDSGHLPDTINTTDGSPAGCIDNAAAVEWDGVTSGSTLVPDAPASAPIIADATAFGNTVKSPSYIGRLSFHRHGGTLVTRWRTLVSTGVVGFDVFAGTKQLNHRMLAVHRSRDYVARVRWNGQGRLSLHVIMRDGEQVVVHGS